MTKLIRFFLALYFLLLYASLLPAQICTVSGTVVDAKTKKPLAFVNFSALNNSHGSSTDIDGKFNFSFPPGIKQLLFTYVGYEPYLFQLIDTTLLLQTYTIYLKQKQVELKEVVVVAGENPAHRIVKRVMENKDKNDPEKMDGFSYTSYNKMIFTLASDSLANKDSIVHLSMERPDTVSTLKSRKGVNSKQKSDTAAERLIKETKEWLDKKYILMMESISSRKFMKPDRSSEVVMASRVSGFQNPSFVLLATQLQSFSFYKDVIVISDKEYINPISKGSLSKYSYIIEDTTYAGTDSIFIISFKPKKGKKFDGLTGLLYINSNGYAVQNVIAEPFGAHEGVHAKVQQKYEFLENKHWFPTQLNTDILFKGSKINSLTLLGIGRSYLKEIVLNPELKKNDFNRIDVKIADNVSAKTEDFWNKYRVDALNTKERSTYQTLDSIGKAEKFDRKLKLFEVVLSGKYPIGPVDLDLNRILDYNEFEGTRLGAGLHTNGKVSNYFSVGGYGAYGFKDKAFKYGGDLILTPFKDPTIQLKTVYINDVIESGGTNFLEDANQLLTQDIRKLYVNTMDLIEKKEVALTFRALQYVKVNAFINTQTRTVAATNPYRFGEVKNEQVSLSDKFQLTELGASVKFAYKEKFISTTRTEISEGTEFPILWLNVSKGLSGILDGKFDYLKVDAKIEKSFFIPNLGRPSVQLNGGFVEGAVPYTLLNNGKGSFAPYGISSPNSFETMGMNEFLSSKYMSLFFTHSFGTRLIRTEKFNPKISIVSKVGFGSLNQPENHFNIPFKTMEKGYYESGIVFDNLLKYNLLGFGVGAFYRYGPYGNNAFKDNIAVKFTIGFAL